MDGAAPAAENVRTLAPRQTDEEVLGTSISLRDFIIRDSAINRQQFKAQALNKQLKSRAKSSSKPELTLLPLPTKIDGQVGEPIDEYQRRQEEQISKAEAKAKALSMASMTRAETEVVHLLSSETTQEQQNLENEVKEHVKGMQDFIAGNLKAHAFLDSHSSTTEDLFMDYEQKRKAEFAQQQEKARVDEEKKLRQEIENEMVMRRTGRGRRLLAVQAGGTGDIPLGYFTERPDFRPIPANSTGTRNVKNDMQAPEVTELHLNHHEDVFQSLTERIASIKLQISSSSSAIQRKLIPDSAETERTTLKDSQEKKTGITARASSIHKSKSIRGVSGKVGPRVPTVVANLWETSKAIHQERELETHPLASSFPNRKHRPLRRESVDYVTFGSSNDTLNVFSVVAAQNMQVHSLAEEVLGHLPVSEDVSRDERLELDLESAKSPEDKLQTDVPKIGEDEGFRKLQPPPEPVFYNFSLNPARILDARNRRVPTSSLPNQLYQPQLQTNSQSRKIQSSIYHISEPPTLSAATYASTNRSAETAFRNQYKLAPTLLSDIIQSERSNPVVMLPDRKLRGSLADVFGIAPSRNGKLDFGDSLLEKVDLRMEGKRK